MKIAYCSPLNPIKSGISDYSEEILSMLFKRVDIDLFIDADAVTNKFIAANFKVFNISKLSNMHINYDLIVYHMGNNINYHGSIYEHALKYPGIVVLHDYCLQNFFLGKYYPKETETYLKMLEDQYGKKVMIEGDHSLKGKRTPIWETEEALLYPLNHEIINCSKLVLVHSMFAKRRILESELNSGMVDYLPFPSDNPNLITEEEKERLRKKYNLDLSKIVLSSFGFVSRAKRIDKTLNALSSLKKKGINNFIYLIVGEVIDDSLDIEGLIKELDLYDEVKIIGYTDLVAFKEYIQLSDICLNLRYPTMGETSASLFRILGYGKPVIVSDCGSFSDLPKEISRHVRIGEEEESDIAKYVSELIGNDKLRIKMGKSAFEFIKREHSIDRTIDTYVKSFEETLLFDALEYSLKKFADVKKEVVNDVNGTTRYEEAIVELLK